MARLELEDFEFREENDKVKFIFMRYYHFLVEKKDLEKIGSFTVEKNFIDFDMSDKSMNNKINRVLENGMSNLISSLGKHTVYVHKNSGIPLLGTNEFGIVDRDTNIIEVKAHTLCNLDCIYCSVDAGKSSGKGTEFVVEPEYLVEEFRKIAAIKKQPVEASINPQGEPLMYSGILRLIRGLKALEGVKIVSTNTNGVLLTEKLVDDLAKAGLDRINLSLNTINQKTASELAGSFYALDNVKKIIDYCEGKIEVLIAPLIVPGYNDEQLDELLKFCKSLKKTPKIGIQNFLEYKKGRNPVKSKSMDWFDNMLMEKERKYGLKLLHTAEDFAIFHDEKVPKPFMKNDYIEAQVVSSGKYPKELLAVSGNRCMIIIGTANKGTIVKVRLVRDKHNIFKGVI